MRVGLVLLSGTFSNTLPAQVQAHLQFLDELLISFGPKTSVLLVRYGIRFSFVPVVTNMYLMYLVVPYLLF
jgi:hypothetical protein